ncbi:long-chain fatty acid transport protein 4 [Eurytemora carolleeae]|uniref:long-chain fatty acid transport protein 4 n=1 Tax=Eurytemora carolleeae TaxID=1294199 RepID=UPI000C78BFF2|nr:long-chain fatty acid transport protein 4 [Eurytemora carolleeae]|eukprot:XP_023328130.1 long-chain fatty acid transport protein 4-like [Eurytemora affinis]
MIPKEYQEYLKYGMYGGAGLALAVEFQNLKLAYNTIGRDIEYGYRIGNGLRHMLNFQKNNMTIHQLFYNTCRNHPQKVMIYFEEEEWTFQDIEDYSNRVGNYFLEQGWRRGDVVALFMENKPEYVGILLGLSKIGVTAALINTNLTMSSLIHCVTVGNCSGIIFDYQLSEQVQDVELELRRKSGRFELYQLDKPDLFSLSPLEISLKGSILLEKELNRMKSTPVPKSVRKQIQTSDSLCYIYTSGTTGLPKAAYQDHSRFYMGSNMATFGCGVQTDDRVYSALPMYHSSSMWMAVGAAINVGCSVIVRKKFSASNYWEDCARYKATCAQYIGEICRFLLQSKPNPAEKQHSLRMMYGVGLRPEIWKEFVTRFNIPSIREFYGSTEGTYGTINIRSKEGACGFIPQFLNYNPFALIRVDEDTDEVLRDKSGLCITCKPGEPGEMVGLVRTSDRGGPGKFKAYVDDKDPNKGKIIRNVWKKGDMCFRSGDILVMDYEGWLYFKDRKGDTFRWRGENVSTTEVEGVIAKLLDNVSNVVYGVEVPGSEGKAGMAAIQTGNSIDLDKLCEGLKKELPSYARPIFIRLVKHLDITGTYKLQKTELQKEGFDVERIQDEIYFMGPKDVGYRRLDSETYKNLISNLQLAKL